MRRPKEIARDEALMTTLGELTGAFEGIASMRIAQVKDAVLQSTKFFNELWQIYSQLSVDEVFQFGREKGGAKPIDKDLAIIITAEGGLSGDIDLKLVELLLQDFKPDETDIIVIGHHGATQLAQRGVAYKKYFKMPVRDRNLNVMPITREVPRYRTTKVYYQEYVSLMIQDVKRIELSRAVKDRADAARQDEVISEANYIFEPSTYAVAAYLERSMIQIAISQLILESKLAQYASRFRAMSASHDLAEETRGRLHLDYNRARRAVKDERLKEVINGLKKARAGSRS